MRSQGIKISLNTLALSLLLVSAFLAGKAFAHSGGHEIRFVAVDGRDSGTCATAQKPCRSLRYAISQAMKGDEVHVAQGEYHIKASDRLSVLTGMTPIRGGFSRIDNFAQAAPDKYPTILYGLPFESRIPLAKNGFILQQDSKGEDRFLSAKDNADFVRYQAITQAVEGPATCTAGKAGVYDCQNVDLLSHIPLAELSSHPTAANDIWGFIDKNDNHEYALIGLNNGTAVVDVTDAAHPHEVGTINGLNSIWRDIKVYQCRDDAAGRFRAYAYVTTEASQGLQVIDLSGLPTSVKLKNTMTDFSGAHNVYLSNTDYSNGGQTPGTTAALFVAGAHKNGGGHRVYELTDPVLPALKTVSLTGYMHDGTSLLIDDARASQCAAGHNPCQVYIDFNEDTVDLWDLTDKAHPLKLSTTPYVGASYTHSGWWSEDKQFVFIQDELDERNLGLNTTVRTLDIGNLKSPSVTGVYTGPTRAIDHNGFTKGNRYYISNYRRGLTVLDITDANHAKDIGWFDTFMVPSENTAEFNGAWGTYPFLPSGNILVSDIEYGLFVLKDNTNPLGHVNADNFASCAAPVAPTPGTIAMANATSTVDESAGTISVTVARTGGSSGAVSVNFTTRAGTADTSDYAESSGTLNWADGDTASKTISVAITDDPVAESGEVFFVDLSSTTGGAGLGMNSTAITINANDGGGANAGILGAANCCMTIAENIGNLTLTVTRTGGASGAVSVDYATRLGTASSSDFTATSGTLNWADGDSADKTITVAITDDNVADGSETFMVDLTNPSGGATLGTATFTVVFAAVDGDPAATPSGGSGYGSSGGSWPVGVVLVAMGLAWQRRRQRSH